MTSRFYNGDLREAPVEFAQVYEPNLRPEFLEEGYTVVEDSPRSPYPPYPPCLLHKQNVLSYAFTVPVSTLQAIQGDGALDPALTTPVTALRQMYDHVGLIVKGDPSVERVLVAQELAFPGWQVSIDGAPATLEPVGQMVGVILPSDTELHQILFVYDPPLLKLGGLITIITALACILYLLEFDRRLVRTIQPRRAPVLPLASAAPAPRPTVPVPVDHTDNPPDAAADTAPLFPVRAVVVIVVATSVLVLLASRALAALWRRARG